MIGFLEGLVKVKRVDSLVVQTAGVGYLVQCGSHIAGEYECGDEIALFIETKVKETDISLFGFTEERDQDLFNELLKVHGVGPKVGLSILAKIGYEKFCQAVLAEDAKLIAKADGVGSKTASRIATDLEKYVEANFTGSRGAVLETGKKMIIMNALTGLGFNNDQSEKALDLVLAENDGSPDKDVKLLIKSCLSHLG